MRIVFLTVEGYGVPHLDWFLKTNRNLEYDIYVSNLSDNRTDAWRNCDRNVRDYYKSVGRFCKDDVFLFLEWDVLVNCDLKQKFDFGFKGICGRNIVDLGQDWPHFVDLDKLPKELREKAIGIVPFGIIQMGRNFLELMCSPAFDYLYNDDIFCELRTPSLANFIGCEIRSNPSLDRCEWFPIQFDGGENIYHSMKP